MEDEDTGERHVEYSSRALIKLQQAARVFQSLEEDVDRWNAEHLLLAPTRSPYDGPPRLEIFRPQALDELPLLAWESAFHDGVHNLRVALDTLCFEIAHIEEVPPNPGKIHFPVTQHRNEWSERTKHLGTIPAPLLERIRLCQSWARTSDDGEPDPLTLISSVDNADKHRATGAFLETFAMSQWRIRESQPLPPDLASTPEWPLELWMELTMTPPPERGQGWLMPVMAWPFVRYQGLFANLADGQRWLHSHTRRMVAFVASGRWPEEEFEPILGRPVWSPWPSPALDADAPADGSPTPPRLDISGQDIGDRARSLT